MSIAFHNIKEAILGIPYYEIPFDYKYVYHSLKKKINKNHDIPEEFDEIKYNIIDEKLNELLEILRDKPNFRVLNTGKVIYTEKEPINGYICPACGYDYDGNAQCGCYYSYFC